MKKEKVNLFEKIDINDPDYAQRVYDKETEKFKFKLICGGISLLTSIAWLCVNAFGMNSVAANITGLFIPVGIIATILSSPKSIFARHGKSLKSVTILCSSSCLT